MNEVVRHGNGTLRTIAGLRMVRDGNGTLRTIAGVRMVRHGNGTLRTNAGVRMVRDGNGALREGQGGADADAKRMWMRMQKVSARTVRRQVCWKDVFPVCRPDF